MKVIPALASPFSKQNDCVVWRRAAFILELLNWNALNIWVKKEKSFYLLIQLGGKRYKKCSSTEKPCDRLPVTTRTSLKIFCLMLSCTAATPKYQLIGRVKATAAENTSRWKDSRTKETQVSLELGVWLREVEEKQIFLRTGLSATLNSTCCLMKIVTACSLMCGKLSWQRCWMVSTYLISTHKKYPPP